MSRIFLYLLALVGAGAIAYLGWTAIERLDPYFDDSGRAVPMTDGEEQRAV